MKSKLLISVASAALIGVGGIAFAQAPSPQSQGGASSAPPAAQSGGSMGVGTMQREESAPAGKMAPREGASGQRAQEQPGSGMKGAQDKAASDNMKSNKNAAESDSKMAPNKAASEKSMDNNKAASDTKTESKSGTTTGQAGAGGKQLTSEQRTSIHTSITKMNVRPVTKVNFSISVGTRVPRGVEFHPLPVEVINIYPDWRGYEFILVNDQIVVVNPRTLEIVAVLDA